MKNKIDYNKVLYICEGQALHFESDSSFGGSYYKCYIRKDGVKYLLLCSVLKSTLQNNNLFDDLNELLFSNALTVEWMNWDFFNLSIIHPDNQEKEIIFIKE